MTNLETIVRPIRLKNKNCIYCGVLFDGEHIPHTDEHVIGRRFVPKGSLNGQWNVIAFACKRCNKVKADLEDDISAISLLSAVADPTTDAAVRADAARKIKADGAVSRFTRKPVRESMVSHEVSGTLMGAATLSFTFSGPPHVEPRREIQLANFHVQAFFFLITYDQKTGIGGFLPGHFQAVIGVPKSDWGNPILREFQRIVASWSLRVNATGADGYFQIMIRRREPDAVWAWAVEWNRHKRLIGFFGEETDVRALLDSMPALAFKDAGMTAEGHQTRTRTEVALAEIDDSLFEQNAEGAKA